MNRFLSLVGGHRKIGWPDLVVMILLIGVLYAVIDLGKGMVSPLSFAVHPRIHLSIAYLPYYAGRSLLRMFIAYFLSLAFSLLYGRIAAYNKFAGKIMIPALDILQSVPVLGFLSVTVTFFLNLFPGSELGAECASIFAIFTAQAWNMTFSFYQSLITIPNDLREAAYINRLKPYARFRVLEVPYSMIGLIWNSMMSFGGSWFFLAASESISVLHERIQLPGIGSYMATAMEKGNVNALIAGIITMIIVIVAVDQFVWRPLVAWAEKFKLDMNESDDAMTSWFLQLLRRSTWLQSLGEWLSPFLYRMSQAISFNRKTRKNMPERTTPRRWPRWILILLGIILLLFGIRYAFAAVLEIATLGIWQILDVIKLGFYTFLRVMFSTLLGALWTIPVGVAIGTNNRLSRIAQPFVQIAASFPSNAIFPLVTLLYLMGHINFQIGAIPLMMLGTQWYILFSVIAGAMAIPSSLKEASSILRLRRIERWKTMILPAIFPFLVTGGITASGGAWNASIVAEIVTWRSHTLTASGIGSYITNATNNGNWAQILWGIIVMSTFVVIINHFFWRKLQNLAQTKYHLD